METNIYKGQRVLYKNNSNWKIGNLVAANLKEDDLYFTVKNINGIEESATLENLFLNARELDDWEKDPDVGTLITKENFIKDIEEGLVNASDGTAYVSDGIYQYYNIPKLHANWIKKQPFDYVVWLA